MSKNIAVVWKAMRNFVVIKVFVLQPESIDLALQILDGYNFKGNILSVQRAEFQMKGDFNPSMRRKLTKQEKKKARLQQEK